MTCEQFPCPLLTQELLWELVGEAGSLAAGFQKITGSVLIVRPQPQYGGVHAPDANSGRSPGYLWASWESELKLDRLVPYQPGPGSQSLVMAYLYIAALVLHWPLNHDGGGGKISLRAVRLCGNSC
jgi:hypothetical protein